MACRSSAEVPRFTFAFRLNALDSIVTWDLCAACLRMAYIAAATGDFGDVTVLTKHTQDLTGIFYRSRKKVAA